MDINGEALYKCIMYTGTALCIGGLCYLIWVEHIQHND